MLNDQSLSLIHDAADLIELITAERTVYENTAIRRGDMERQPEMPKRRKLRIMCEVMGELHNTLADRGHIPYAGRTWNDLQCTVNADSHDDSDLPY